MSPRRTFGATWWGRAWVDALEHRARLDPNRLPRGRTYARQDRVRALDTAPGEITATVAGNRPSPYQVRIRVRTFTDAEWDAVIDAICARAAHAAALLDGDLEPGLVDDARAAGMEVLPGPGDLQPRCSCPDWADPCKHAAAVCYLVADALDDDPFALFALRGRPRDELLAAVRRRRSRRGHDGVARNDNDTDTDRNDNGRSRIDSDRSGSGDDRGDGIDSGADHSAGSDRLGQDPMGVVARDAWAREPGSLPALPALRELPGPPAPWPVDPPDEAPFTAAGLRALAADAAHRSLAVLRGDADTALGLHADADLARRAALALGTDAWPTLVAAATAPVAGRGGAAGANRVVRGSRGRRAAAGDSRDDAMTERELVGQALAWRVAGADGLAARDEPSWTPSPLVMASARDALRDAGIAARSLSVRTNRITIDDHQLRLGRDGPWWRFVKRANRWELDAGPAADPDELVDTEPASGSTNDG